jgi:hypothetical protein
MHPALQLVTDRLPQVGDRAARLFEDDDVFRELCEEYETCTEAAARIATETGKGDALLHEYVALRLRLEGEVLRYLSEHGDP